MYKFFFGWMYDEDPPKDALLYEGDNLDSLMLDSNSKTIKYKTDLSNYVLNEDITCKIKLKIGYFDGSSEYRSYGGKYYENKELGKYYVMREIKFRPKNDTGKMTYKVEIYRDNILMHEGALSFKFKMNDSLENTLETISISYDKKHELIMSVVRESNKYIMDNLKYVGAIKD